MTTGSTRGHNQAGVVTHYDDVINPEHQTGLWRTCPLVAIASSPTIAFDYNESFHSYDATDDWTLTQAVAGTAAISTTAPGTLDIDSNSVTVTQGVNLQNLNACFVPAANKSIWFEARIQVDEALTAELFIGLCASDTTIIGTSAMTTNNRIGFQCVTDDGVLLFTSEKNTAGTTTTSGTLVEATYVNVGFYVNGVTSVEGFYNGASVGTAHGTANVPIVAMFPSFVCQSGGTNDPVMHLAGYRVFQLR